MKIMVRAILGGLVALALSGCILQSRAPLFGDAQAKLLLDGYANVITFEKSGGDWVKSKDQIAFVKQAGHYLATLDKTELLIRFVPIEGNWWVLQAEEASKPTAYLLVEAKPAELLFYPIACKTLKEAGSYEKTVEFVDSDCFIKPESDSKALFAGFTTHPGEPTTRFAAAP